MGKTSQSASAIDGIQKINELLSKELPHLNLEEFIVKNPLLENYGATCDVYKGYCNYHKKDVAIKCIKTVVIRQAEDVNVKRLTREISIWVKMKHTNILPFLGYYIDEHGRFNLISEWMVHGNLHDYYKTSLKSGESNLLMIEGIAEGLSYLHSENVIHADLKSFNVLVSLSREPRVADFGLSHIHAGSVTALAATINPSNLKGSYRWMATELLDMSYCLEVIKSPNKESDVWSFGMVIYELLVKAIPYSHVQSDSQVIGILMKGRLPTKPKTLRPSREENERTDYEQCFWNWCEICWRSPESRPTMEEICVMIREVKGRVKASQSNPRDPLTCNDCDPTLQSDKCGSFTQAANTVVVDEIPTGYITPKLHSIGANVGSHIEELQLISRTAAGFSEVFRGQLRDGSIALTVAVKKMRRLPSKEKGEVKRLANEARTWSEDIRHKNILPILGYFIGRDDYLNIISAYMQNGSLAECRDLVHRGRETGKIIYGIAAGLRFLHDRKIVHGDLNCRSIFVSNNGQPLLSGFTDSRIASASEMELSSMPSTHSARWLSIELIPSSATDVVASPNGMSDIWSFGMTVYEVISKREPYAELPHEIAVLSAIANGYLPPRPDFSGTPGVVAFENTIFDICERCWERDPSSRPSAFDIVKLLYTPYIELIRMEQNEVHGDSENVAISEIEEVTSASNNAELSEASRNRQTDKQAAIQWKVEYNSELDRTLDITLAQAVDSMHIGVVTCMRFSPNGSYLAVGCSSTSRVEVYDACNFAHICSLKDDGQDAYNSAMIFSTDDKWLVTGSNDRTVRVWDMANRRIERILPHHEDAISDLDFDDNIVASSCDKTIRLWNLESGTHEVIRTPCSQEVDSEEDEEDLKILSIAFGMNARIIAAGTSASKVLIWDTTTRELLWQMTTLADRMNAVSFAENGRWLIGGGSDKQRPVRFWSMKELGLNGPTTIETNAILPTFCCHKKEVSSVASSSDGAWTVSGGKDRCLVFWRTNSAEIHLKLWGHRKPVSVVDFSPTSNTVASADEDGRVLIWKYSSLPSVIRKNNSDDALLIGIPDLLLLGDNLTTRTPAERMDRLFTLLKDLPHLDLSGKINDIHSTPRSAGATCDVFVGYLDDESKRVQVAIKKVRVFLSKKEIAAKSLAKELRVWSMLSHRNVLPLLGYFIEGGEFPNFISPWMEDGSLFDYLNMISGGMESFSLISGIAAGLAYLHDKDIIHADLKSPNVLISASKEPLLADFGVSQVLYPLFSTAGLTSGNSLKGTVRWMARELLVDFDDESPSVAPITPNKMSDVWAFGMVLYEIRSRNVPYLKYKDDFQVAMAISKGKLPGQQTLPEMSSDPVLTFYEADFWNLCNMCWEPSSKRPTMSDIEASIASLSNEANELFDAPCDNSFLARTDVSEIPQTSKREGENWTALLNPTAEDIADLKDLGKIPCESRPCCVRFSPTGKIVAVACAASIRLIDIVENNEVSTFALSGHHVSDMCFSPNGKYLAVAMECLQVYKHSSSFTPRKGDCFVWNLETEEILHKFEGHKREINAVTFSTGSLSVATGSSDGTARLWDIRTGQELFKVSDAQEDVDAGVSSVALSPTDVLLAAGCFDNVVRLWDRSGELVGQLSGHADAVYCVTFSTDGRRLFSGSLDNSIKCWNIDSLTDSPSIRSEPVGAPLLQAIERKPFCKFSVLGNKDGILGLAQSVCGKWIASLSLDQNIVFWNSRNGHAQFLIKPGYPVKSIAMTNGTHGGILAAVTGDDEVRLWTFTFKEPYSDV